MNYKKQAAFEAAKLVKPHQIIGLGAGSTIAYLANELASNKILMETACFISSSAETTVLIKSLGLQIAEAGTLRKIDVYFDGCDQLDRNLNAFKSGGGIHTDEKAIAAMANAFILLGDTDKYTSQLTTDCPLTVEVMPAVAGVISHELEKNFDVAHIKIRKGAGGQNFFTSRNCVLLEVSFHTLPELALLNQVKSWPGVIDHSLFYQLATAAIICGPDGIMYLTAPATRNTYSLSYNI